MAITAVNEINRQRGGSEDERGHRRYRRTFRVETDTVMGSASVKAASGLPRRYDRYIDPDGVLDNSALAVEIDAQVEDEEFPYQWIVTVDYSSNVWDAILRGIQSGGRGNASDPNAPPGSGNDPQNPINRPSEISIEAMDTAKPVYWDRAHKAIRNSAGDLFDNPLEMSEGIQLLTIVRAEPAFDANDMHDYWDTVNDEIFFGRFPGYAKCKTITGRTEYENGYTFWMVTYRFALLPNKYWRGKDANGNGNPEFQPGTDEGATYAKANGWNVRDALLLDAGWRDKNGKAAKHNTDGSAPTRPALLDGAGLFLADQTANPKWLQFLLYEPIPYSPLNLP